MEYLKNIITPFSERVKSPLYGAFVVSWMLWNWTILFALFSGEKIIKGQCRIDYISGRISLNELKGWENAILWPLAMAGFYLLVIPWIDVFVFEYLEKRRRQKLEKKYTILRAFTVSGSRHAEVLVEYNSLKEELAKTETNLRDKEALLSERELSISKQEKDNQAIRQERDKIQSRLLNVERNYERALKGLAIDVFASRWVVFWREKGTGVSMKREEFIVDSSNKYFFINERGEQVQKHDIFGFMYDNEKGKVQFIKRGTAPNLENQIRNVILEKDGNNYKGIEVFYTGRDSTIVYEVKYVPLDSEVNGLNIN